MVPPESIVPGIPGTLELYSTKPTLYQLHFQSHAASKRLTPLALFLFLRR